MIEPCGWNLRNARKGLTDSVSAICTMSTKLFFDLREDLRPVLRSGDLARCEQRVAQALAALPHSPFHCILDLSITNPVGEVAEYFNTFFREEAPPLRVGAVYTEMNGFDINPDRWYFEASAFAEYGGHDEYDWLADCQWNACGDQNITGLELLQDAYGSNAFGKEEYSDASYVAGLLVVVKFQDLIRRTAPHIKELRVPLLATAHGYCFIYETRREN
jgi:hypothetical protein